MDILIFRHALAEDRVAWNKEGKSDALRPLCKKGIVRFAQAVQGLDKIIKSISTIYSSQYTRAVQTGEILHGHFKNSNLEIIEGLNPGYSVDSLLDILKSHKTKDVVAFVGHHPDLSRICSHLVCGHDKGKIKFGKGGVACIRYENGIGELEFLLTQKQLQGLSFNKSLDLQESSDKELLLTNK